MEKEIEQRYSLDRMKVIFKMSYIIYSGFLSRCQGFGADEAPNGE